MWQRTLDNARIFRSRWRMHVVTFPGIYKVINDNGALVTKPHHDIAPRRVSARRKPAPPRKIDARAFAIASTMELTKGNMVQTPSLARMRGDKAILSVTCGGCGESGTKRDQEWRRGGFTECVKCQRRKHKMCRLPSNMAASVTAQIRTKARISARRTSR